MAPKRNSNTGKKEKNDFFEHNPVNTWCNMFTSCSPSSFTHHAGSVRLKCSRFSQNSLFSVSRMIAALLIIWSTFQPVRKCFSRLTSRIIRLTLIGKKHNYQLSSSLRETIHVERHTAKSCSCFNIWMWGCKSEREHTQQTKSQRNVAR